MALAKIPLVQSVTGFATLNGTFNDIPRTFILDTTLPGLAHKCNYHSLEMNGPKWNETCPRECTSNLRIPMFSSRYGAAYVDPFAANLTVGDISLPTFKSGRICGKEQNNALYDLGRTANGVFGIGPGAPNGYVNVTTALDSIPWTKYSIYLTKTIQETGSFLLPGGVDADMIAQQSLVETKLPATTETGWTVNIDAFTTSGAAIKADCSPTSPCIATVASSSPVIQLGAGLWDSVLAGIDRRDCYKTTFGEFSVYRCDDMALLPNITFALGDRTFYMNKTDYTIPVPTSDEGSVYVLIARQNRNRTYASEWILGVPFLRSFYASFDKESKSVSFYCKEGVNCASKGQPAPGSPATSGAPMVSWLRSSLIASCVAVVLGVLSA